MTHLVVLSGGMDSATALYWALARTRDVKAISFDYGQRHRTELDYAAKLAAHADVPHQIFPVGISALAPTSSLTNPDIEVPHGHYEEESMKATVVPNRNMTFISLAVASAMAMGGGKVVVGVHDGDHAVYADCRREFINSMRTSIDLATEGAVELVAPFVDISKADIATTGGDLGVPYELTWSCYEGGDIHCGRCGTCVERAEALALAGVDDPTEYADPDFWKETTNG